VRRLASAVALAAVLILAGAPAAFAHPLGNFTVNRFAHLEVRPGALVIAYAVDMAEIPTFQERRAIDANGDDELTPDEADAYAENEADRILGRLEVTVDAEPLHPVMTEAFGGLGEGQGGLAILRLDIRYEARLPAGARHIGFADRNDPAKLGWREVVATAACGATIAASDVPSKSSSADLRRYPATALSRPLDVRSASLDLGPENGSPCPAATPSVPAAPPTKAPEGFAGLIARERLSPSFVVVAVLLALGFGALHALGPGHGKTITAAYLVGSGAGVRHALLAGGAVALMHTATVLALGLVTLVAASVFPPETVYPWLALFTGLVVLGLGTWLLRERLRAPDAEPRHAHVHAHAREPVSPLSRRGLAALAVGGGLLPSPTAVVLLTGAIALDRLVFGLVLVAAFSVGLAAALAAVGLAALRVGELVGERMSSRWGRAIPVVSAVAVMAAGVYLTFRAAVRL
jgi:ABC-type nickel/cobalt efflux system permease component RcnA